MPDITMCETKCEKSPTCYRSWATPHEYWQAWFTDDPRDENGYCKHYWHREQPDISYKEGEKK